MSKYITLGLIFSHLLKLRHHFRIYYISFQFLQLQSLKLCFCLVVFCKPTYRFKTYFNISNQIMKVIRHFLLCGLEWSGDFNDLEKPLVAYLSSSVSAWKVRSTTVVRWRPRMLKVNFLGLSVRMISQFFTENKNNFQLSKNRLDFKKKWVRLSSGLDISI